MYVLRSGCQPKSAVVVAARFCVIGAIAVALSGCASGKDPSYVRGPMVQKSAAAKAAEMEDDGLPVQAPPVRVMQPGEDDPTQPWSPRYGKGGQDVPLVPRGTPPRVPGQVDASLKPSFAVSSSRARPMTEDEADAVMQAAMAVHEMRNR